MLITHNSNSDNANRYCWIGIKDSNKPTRLSTRQWTGDSTMNIRLMGSLLLSSLYREGLNHDHDAI